VVIARTYKTGDFEAWMKHSGDDVMYGENGDGKVHVINWHA